MSLSQALFHQQSIFALFMYCLSIVIVIPLFAFIHDKLANHFLQFCWDKIGMPLIRAFLIITFILLAYPVNFGLESAPSIGELLAVDDMRSSFLINMIFLLTFLFPLVPVLGKLDELVIPLQGLLCSMIVFNWLCQGLNIQDYNLLPGFNVFALIIFISLMTHWIAKYIAEHTGDYLDKLFHREGFQTLTFQAVVLVMQSPVIFMFGLALGKQLT